MHIAVNGWYAATDTAGSGQYLHHLLHTLPATDPAVRWSLLLPEGVIAPEYGGVEVVRRSLPHLPRQLQKLWWEQMTVPRLARTLRADALWVPYWASPLRQSMPTVVTVHDLIPLLLPLYRGSFLNRAYTRLVAASARRAAAVITVSHASKRDIIDHLGISPERVHVVWHGPNQEEKGDTAPEEGARVAEKYHLPERYFLYLGGFDVRKNLSGILQGYAAYLKQGGDSAIKMVIAGRLPAHDSAFAPDPRVIARSLGIEEQVYFPGFVEEAHKRALYAGSTAFLFPSLYEGFGMMALEAQHFGAPVITSTS